MTITVRDAPPWHRSLEPRAIIAAIIAVVVVHAVLGARYDLFRDELYFIVCGQHPAFGYVDQPPLVPWLAAAGYRLGLGAFGVRLPVALAAGAIVAVTWRFVRLIGGQSGAVALAVLAVVFAPMLLGMGATLNTTAFDPLCWTAIAWLLARAIRLGDGRALVWAGGIAGIDLEIKYALAMWAVALGIGLVATPQRRVMVRPAFWLGLSLAAVLALPSAWWQWAHGLPFLELTAAARTKNAEIGLPAFVLNQIAVMNPMLAPLWIAGLIGPFCDRRLADLRFLPLAFLAYFASVRLGHGKDYYLAACYPALFIAGAVVLERWARTGLRKAVMAGGAMLAMLVSLAVLPIVLPVLSPALLESFVLRTGLAPQQQERSFQGTVLPQVFADQLGWRDFAGQVTAAWNRIPPAERARTGIKVDNYGEAAAVDLYAGPLGLPPALSGHNQYFVWGLRGQQPISLLVVQDDVAQLRPYCRQTVVLGQTHARFAMAYENGKAIAWCRGLRIPIGQIWPGLKNFS